ALEVGGAVPLLVDRVPVYEEQDVVAEVAGDDDPAGADVDRVQRVLGQHAERQKVDRLIQRLDAVAAQLLGRDGGGGGGRGAGVLERLGGGRQERRRQRALE